MRPQCKVAAAFLLVVAVVATPREAVWAYGVHITLVAGLTLLACVPARFVARRLPLAAPFVVFALALPFVGRGPRLEVVGLSLAEEGLWAAWNILVKTTIGLWTTLLLAATTPVTDVLRGLERLRVPRAITAIAGFMVRYGDVITGEMRRMRSARLARGHDARWLWQARAVASSAGTLFIRSFERGERVYLAMLARGFDGSLPELDRDPAPPGEWAVALLAPAAAACVAAVSWMTLA